MRDSVGAVPSGRGGANIGHADNGAILLDNPAAMVHLVGTGLLELGIDAIITDLDYSDPENSTNGKFRPAVLPEFAYIRKSADERWAVGLGVFVPAGFSAQWELNNPLLGEHGYKSFGALAKIVPGIAYRLSDQLSIGATLGVGVSHAELEGPFFLQTGPLRGTPTIFDVQATGATPVWSVGMQYQFSDRTALGVTYIDESRFRLDGNLDVDVFGLGPLLGLPDPLHSDFDAEVDVVWPRSLGLGMMHALTERQRISTDILWFDWSHAFDRVDLKLTEATNPLFTAMLGPEIRERFPLDWRDSISVRVGYEFFLTPWDVLRAGYTYNSPNVPDATLTPYIPATIEHTFSAGYGKRWGNCGLDLAYQFLFGPERHVSASELAGGDFASSELKAQAHGIFLTFSYRY
ncbi:MAG: outer membrane protein transport protein [Planctomycetes bacterium]|nr:outer membrane protein transport protein [Planctomycetota bacterium]